mmetsp:Transcript_3384/g.11467  ORF Transcript_3384/g.11467 Transcript_3384/m.11467 type:complete len:225 (-) Transcript_3384:709-1383(-)
MYGRCPCASYTPKRTRAGGFKVALGCFFAKVVDSFVAPSTADRTEPSEWPLLSKFAPPSLSLVCFDFVVGESTSFSPCRWLFRSCAPTSTSSSVISASSSSVASKLPSALEPPPIAAKSGSAPSNVTIDRTLNNFESIPSAGLGALAACASNATLATAEFSANIVVCSPPPLPNASCFGGLPSFALLLIALLLLLLSLLLLLFALLLPLTTLLLLFKSNVAWFK